MKGNEIEKQRPSVVDELSGTVLEIGFGSGLNLPYYRGVTKLYALEPSQELYNLAKDLIKRTPFPIEHLLVSAENIPLNTNTLDAVVSTWTLCSIPRPEIALKEIFRVLKPGGKFVFIEHGKSPIIIIAKLQEFLTPISRCVAGGCHMDREIDRLVKEAGFQIQKLEKFQQKSRPLAFMYKGIAIVKK